MAPGHYRPPRTAPAEEPRPRARTPRSRAAPELLEQSRQHFAEYHPDLAALAERWRCPPPDPEPLQEPDPEDPRHRIRVLLRRFHIQERGRRRLPTRHACTQEWREQNRDRNIATKREHDAWYHQVLREEITTTARQRAEEAARLRARQCQEEDPLIEERWERICRAERLKRAPIPRASCERMRARQTEERIRQALHDLDRDPVEEILADYLCRLRRIAGTADRDGLF